MVVSRLNLEIRYTLHRCLSTESLGLRWTLPSTLEMTNVAINLPDQNPTKSSMATTKPDF
jgi:hypothetical protein